MREARLVARPKRRRKATTRPGKGRWRAPDLVKRDFGAARLNRKWYGDGTEIGTGEGKLHLVSVMDAASRRILGFALGERHDAQLAYGALAMALAIRGGQAPGVIMHTDQGSEGGFNWSSQHLDLEVWRWVSGSGSRRFVRCGVRCVAGPAAVARREDRVAVLGGDRPRRVERGCGGRGGRVAAGWRRGGSARLAGCRRSSWPRCRGGTCRSLSARRSRSCARRSWVCARSPAGWAARPRRSRGSCAATRRRAATRWSTGRRRRNGMPSGARAARRWPSSPRTSGCATTCRIAWPGRSPRPTVSWCRARRSASSAAATAAGQIGAGRQVVEPGADREPAAGRFP